MNNIGWGQAVLNNNIGYGETAAEYVRVNEDGEVRYTELSEMRVTEGVDPSGFAEVYNTSWSGETLLER
jgi:hypothetical protein